MGSFRVNLVCELLDLAADGVDEVLDRAQGELGVTGICVPVVSPPTSGLRFGLDGTPRIRRSAGGVLFGMQQRHYAATRCKPGQSAEVKPRDLFGRVVEACRKRDLDCRAIVHATTAGRLADQHPHAAAKTAWGDPLPLRVCLVNPDVQAFLAAVCDDLAANHDLTGIELADVHVGRLSSVAASLDPALALGSGGLALLGVCFCESCRQLAASADAPGGLDPAAAARSVEVRLERAFQTGRRYEASAAEVFADDPFLAAQVTAQWRAVVSSLGAIPRRAGCGLTLRIYDDAIIGPTDSGLFGADVAKVAGLMVELVPGPAESVERTAQAVRERAGADLAAEVSLRPYPAQGDLSSDTLVRTLSQLAELGIASVDLQSFGTIPTGGMAGITRAIRFARRTG